MTVRYLNIINILGISDPVRASWTRSRESTRRAARERLTAVSTEAGVGRDWKMLGTYLVNICGGRGAEGEEEKGARLERV